MNLGNEPERIEKEVQLRKQRAKDLGILKIFKIISKDTSLSELDSK